MKENKSYIEGITHIDKPDFIPIDQWEPKPEDMVFRTAKGAIMMDVSSFFQMDSNPQLDTFVMSPKRSYNNEKMREHTTHYLNYFEKFYDPEHELLFTYARLKYLIDFVPAYSREAFIHDLERYIISGYSTISLKIGLMNQDNYALNLTYKNTKNPNLQYSDWYTSHPNMET